MSQAGRVGDTAQCSSDEHEGAGGVPVQGEALLGSPDVIINGRAALRVGDPGQQTGCSGPNTWQASQGSRGVFINGQPAFRYGDETLHCGGTGELVEGSPDVFLGDGPGGTPIERPHDKTATIDVTDALGRPLHGVTVSVSCPHVQREDTTTDGPIVVNNLCAGSTVTVQKALQEGTWDENASSPFDVKGHHHTLISPSNGGVPAPDDATGNDAAMRVVGDPNAGSDDATSSDAKSGGARSGGAAVSSDAQSGDATKKLIHAPAPAGTSNGKKQTVPVQTPAAGNGGTSVIIPTVYNWVELIYRAFGHHIPTGPKDLTLLGVREASLAPVAPGTAVPTDTIEHQAGQSDLADVSFTREHRAPTYNDLLFAVWTDTTAHHKQHVEVFECSIDASPGSGLLHLPFLAEGQLFHTKPGPYNKHFPGHDIALHVFHGMKEHHEPAGATAEHVLAVAMKERGTTESPPGSNRQKYGAWYGDNGAYWCAMFVSWVFTHAGMPEIHYEGCSVGAGAFQNGSWGTWHGSDAKAEPGDIVFYNFPGEATYDHTGIVIKDNGPSITTIEGNTSAPGDVSGSQSNGGGVFVRTRDKSDGFIIGYGRPKFRKPHKEPGSFIRWGGEGQEIHGKSGRGSTLLHHHYFKTVHGKNEPDHGAKRYRRFMHLFNNAKNKAHIPYLIVSSKYVKTYSEWATWAETHPQHTPGAKSVILTENLHSPGGHAHHYVPSYFSLAYAERILEKTRRMHDHHKAEKIRKELLDGLLKLSI